MVVTGGSALIITGLITGLAVVAPSVLPVLLIVAPALTVVSFVFLAFYLKELGEDWWVYLDKQGALNEFLKGLAMTEIILSAMAREQSDRVHHKTVGNIGVNLSVPCRTGCPTSWRHWQFGPTSPNLIMQGTFRIWILTWIWASMSRTSASESIFLPWISTCRNFCGNKDSRPWTTCQEPISARGQKRHKGP